MEKIIEKFYNFHFKENYPFFVPDRESMQKECELYCSLLEEIPKELNEKLSEYSSLAEERHKTELQKAYEHGFRTAINLILESVKE